MGGLIVRILLLSNVFGAIVLVESRVLLCDFELSLHTTFRLFK